MDKNLRATCTGAVDGTEQVHFLRYLRFPCCEKFMSRCLGSELCALWNNVPVQRGWFVSSALPVSQQVPRVALIFSTIDPVTKCYCADSEPQIISRHFPLNFAPFTSTVLFSSPLIPRAHDFKDLRILTLVTEARFTQGSPSLFSCPPNTETPHVPVTSLSF